MAHNTTTRSRSAKLAAASPVKVGDVVGKYRVTELIALGGMGLVAGAKHEVLDQNVAIKFLLPDIEAPGTRERFLREAKAAANIQSEHVVRVFDCGQLESGIPYMVMEYLDGLSLSQLMRRSDALGIEEAIDLIMQALEGVAEAHSREIIHRDLKPSNLFLAGDAPRRTVKVLDFGISKIPVGVDTPVDEDDLTFTSMILGSPRYISPEQARNSKNVDRTTDIWSIGVIVYQLLVNQPPFAGDTIGEILSQILLAAPTPLGKIRADIPPLLTATVRRCLEREPKDRYQSVAELGADLAPHGSSDAIRSLERVRAILRVEPEPGAFTNIDEPQTWLTPTGDSRAHAALTAEAEQTQATVGTWEQRSPNKGGARGMLLAAIVVGAVLLGAFGAWRLMQPPPGDARPAAETGLPPSLRDLAGPAWSGSSPAGGASSSVPSAVTPSAVTPSAVTPSAVTPSAVTPSATGAASSAAPEPPVAPAARPVAPTVPDPPPDPKPAGKDPLEHSD